jgi:phosphoribosyl-ATP pyrophosphohydrolase/phosphoribosyl-AMP cyclohydrolase
MLISTAQQAAALAWDKSEGLIPATVQDAFGGHVLMQAWMNRDALVCTLESGRVTFWSRSRQELWTKGETSGHFLALDSIHADCDRDSLLVLATPHGPTCHLGTDSCFGDPTAVTPGLAFLAQLDTLVAQRQQQRPAGSYTTQLFDAGIPRIAQKVGEEGVEVALAAATGSADDVCNESADLLYHLLVLLRARGLPFSRVIATLKERHHPK